MATKTLFDRGENGRGKEVLMLTLFPFMCPIHSWYHTYMAKRLDFKWNQDTAKKTQFWHSRTANFFKKSILRMLPAFNDPHLSTKILLSSSYSLALVRRPDQDPWRCSNDHEKAYRAASFEEMVTRSASQVPGTSKGHNSSRG
jgi:hypothetical protein